MMPPQNILLAGLRQPHLQSLQGMTLADIMQQRGSDSVADTLIDLIIEDESRIFTMYFGMAEDNLRRQVQLPWVSFCSDAESQAPEGVFLNNIPHPRAYGSFARVLGKYVRRRGPAHAAGGRASPERAAGAEPEAARTWPAEGRLFRRRRRLRPGAGAGFRHAAGSRIATPRACSMSSSTVSRCCVTANTRARCRGASCAGQAGRATPERRARGGILV